MVNPIQVETMERVIGDSQLSVVGISRGYERNGDPDDILKKKRWIWRKMRRLSFTVLD